MKRSAVAYSVLICISVIQTIYYYPRLPDTVASHFDGSGSPDAWCGKAVFAGFGIGTAVFIAFLLLGVQFLSVFLIANMPASVINLPNKDHWLSPARNQQTRADISGIITWFWFYFGCATEGIIVLIYQLAAQANLGAEPQLTGAGRFVLLYCSLVALLLAVTVVRFYRRFKVRPT